MTRDEQTVLLDLLESFLDDSLITEVLEVVRGGKEATVFRCRAVESSGHGYYAAKVYRPMERRSFRNDMTYQQGRVILNHRTRRAYENKTDFGRSVQYGRWVNAEYETQRALFDAGADVPQPIACNGSAILMQWIGDGDGGESPAVQLRHARLEAREAPRLHEQLLSNIELMLRNNVVHSDLSSFNVLYHAGRMTIIDFPQSIDPRMNRAAFELLQRDVQNVCDFFTKFGVRSDPHRIASRLWSRFLRAEL